MFVRSLCFAAVLVLSLLVATSRAGAVSITEFPVAGPTIVSDMTAGPDGNVWFGWGRDEPEGNGLGVLDPRTERFELLPALSTNWPSEPVVAGGAIWILEGLAAAGGFSTLRRVDTQTRAVETIPVSPAWSSLAASRDGRVLYAVTHVPGEVRPLVAFDVATRQTRVLARVPSSAAGRMVVASDGALWSHSENSAAVVRVDPASGAVTRSLPVFVRGLTAGSDADVWAPDFVDPTKVQRFTPTGVEEYPSVGGGPNEFVVMPDGAVWYTTADRGGLARLDPATRQSTMVVSPTYQTSDAAFAGAVGPDGKTLWFGGGNYGQPNIVKVDPDGQGPDVGNMDSVLGKGLGSLVACDGACRGSVDVTLLRRGGARGATGSAARSRRGLRLAGRQVRVRGRTVIGTRFKAQAKRLVRGEWRRARLQVTVRVRKRGSGRVRVARHTVVLKRYGRLGRR